MNKKKNFNLKSVLQKQIFWPLMILLVIILVNGILSKGEFFKIRLIESEYGTYLYGSIIDILRSGSKIILLAIGMTLVLATGGTDISVGSVMAITGAVACSVVDSRILPDVGNKLLVGVFLGLLVAAACGAWNGFLVSKLGIQPIVATMILLVAGRGIAQLITNGKSVSINSNSYYFISGGNLFGLPFPIFIVAFFFVIALLFTRKTAFGLYVESTGINMTSSHFAGVSVTAIKWSVFILCSLMAGVAGLIESAGIKSADANNAGLFMEMDAILAVAIGGTRITGGKFSISASVIGALIIQSITITVYAQNISPQVTLVFKAVIVLIITLVQSPEFKKLLKSLLDHKKSKNRKEVAGI